MAIDQIDLDEFEDDVGLGNEDKKHAKPSREEWFKGEKGKVYRVSLVYFNPLAVSAAKACKKSNPGATKADLLEAINKVMGKRAENLKKSVDELAEHESLDTSNVRFKKIEAHYKEGLGYVVSRLNKDGAEADSVWKTLGEPKKYFSTILVIYPTTKDGDIIKEQLKHNWTVMPWRFGPKIYSRLHQVKEGLQSNDISIASQDLTLSCTNSDFQNFEVDAAGKAVWRMNEDLSSQVLERAVKLYSKMNPFRELSTADLRIKLGIGGGDSSEDVSEGNFDDILSQV